MHMQEVIKPWYQIKNKKFKFLEKIFHFFFGHQLWLKYPPGCLSGTLVTLFGRINEQRLLFLYNPSRSTKA